MTMPAFSMDTVDIRSAATTAVLEAEQAAIGVALNDPAAWDVLRDLRPDDFIEGEHGAHGVLWSALRQDYEDGQAPDFNAYAVRFGASLADLGGGGHVVDLWNKAPPSTTAPMLAEQLSAGAIQRRLQRSLARPGMTAVEISEALGVETEKAAALAHRSKPISATPFDWVAPDTIPAREWLYGSHLVRRFVSSTVAPGGLGKSSLVLVEALAMVTGRALIGDRPSAPLRVWVWSGEDPIEESNRRVAAACIEHRISAADLGGRLFIDSGRDMPLQIGKSTKGGTEINALAVRQIAREVEARGIDVLVIDPFISSHTCDENDNSAISRVIDQWKDIADKTGCAVELVHHVRKPQGTAETTVHDGRGAGAMLAAVRSARVVNGMTQKDAEEFGITDRQNYIRVDNGKSNLAPRGAAKWRRLVTVELGNGQGGAGDKVGVVREWSPPSVFDGLTAHDTRRVQEAINAGQWRHNAQSNDWAGKAVAKVLNLDLNSPTDKAKAAKLLKTWLTEGVLTVEDRPDGHRKPRACVVVGTWVDP